MEASNIRHGEKTASFCTWLIRLARRSAIARPDRRLARLRQRISALLIRRLLLTRLLRRLIALRERAHVARLLLLLWRLIWVRGAIQRRTHSRLTGLLIRLLLVLAHLLLLFVAHALLPSTRVLGLSIADVAGLSGWGIRSLLRREPRWLLLANSAIRRQGTATCCQSIER